MKINVIIAHYKAVAIIVTSLPHPSMHWSIQMIPFELISMYRDNVFNIIGAFDVPRYIYSVERKKFVPYVKLIISLMMSSKCTDFLIYVKIKYSARIIRCWSDYRWLIFHLWPCSSQHQYDQASSSRSVWCGKGQGWAFQRTLHHPTTGLNLFCLFTQGSVAMYAASEV